MDEAEGAALTEHQRYWLERIQACEASGKSITAYAMYDAKKVLVRKGVLPRTQRTRFQRVQMEVVSVGSDWHIRLANGVSVEFSGAVDAGSLSTVLNAVAGLG